MARARTTTEVGEKVEYIKIAVETLDDRLGGIRVKKIAVLLSIGYATVRQELQNEQTVAA